MNIGFFDFSIKKEKIKIYSNSGRLIIDLKNWINEAPGFTYDKLTEKELKSQEEFDIFHH